MGFYRATNHKATNTAQRRTHNEIFGSSGDSPSQLTNFRFTGRVRLPPNRKNSARQRHALRKGEKIAFGGRGSCRAEKFGTPEATSEGSALAEPRISFCCQFQPYTSHSINVLAAQNHALNSNSVKMTGK